MDGNHMKVLEEQIYNDQNIVTYRLLSRLVGIHVNLAKQILSEFHQQAKLDGKQCHATYILSGLIEESLKTPTDAMQIEGDGFLMSSPPVATQESSKSNRSTSKFIRTITLADENDVHEAKRKFSELTSVHVYSLGPAIVQDPILLTTCSYDISKTYDSAMLPAETAQKYGVIANPNAVKRKLTKYVAPAVVIGTAASKGKGSVQHTKQAHKQPSPPPDVKPVSAQARTEPTKTSTTTMKRTTSGSIMNAFANAPPKGSKPKPKEEEEKSVPPSKPKSPSPKPAPRISAKRQQEIDDINKMMEDDEPQELEDFPPDAPAMEESQDTTVSADSPQMIATAPSSQEPKRKRGKRKVLKRTTKRDEKGYLVTKNEYVYESFSEDDESDVPPKGKKSVAHAPVAAATGGDKKKGKANVAGQKSLTSFFGKK